MARLRFGPRLMAVCAHLRISPQLLEHTQIPELRATVQVRVPLAGAPEGTALPKQPTTAEALFEAGWRPDLVRWQCAAHFPSQDSAPRTWQGRPEAKTGAP